MPDKIISIDEAALEEHFEDGQKETVLQLVNNLENGIPEAVDASVTDSLRQAGFDDKVLSYIKAKMKQEPVSRDFDERLKRTLSIWKQDGRLSSHPSHRFTYDELIKADKRRMADFNAGKLTPEMFMDTQFSLEQPMLIPRVISQVVREAVEPTVALTPLLQRINFQAGSTLSFPAMGAFVAADIPEGGEYPEQTLEFAGQVVATIGKSGVAVKMTEEMIRYSLFDVMSMHLRAAGRAMIRHKEQKVSDMISNSGVIYYDNTASKASTAIGSTTGRGIDGAANGTISIENLFRMYASMGDAGYIPNALIMHPFGWLAFALNPSLRAFGFANNGPMFAPRSGAVGSAEQWRVGGLNQETQVSSPGEVATTQSPAPNGFPVPLRIIVSPFVPYNASANTTDIWMVDTNELGVLVVDEDVVTEDFNDPARDIRKVKLRERYAVENINNGQGIRVAKGVVVDRDFAFEDHMNWEAGTGTLASATGYSSSP